jgi:hypothetical protein
MTENFKEFWKNFSKLNFFETFLVISCFQFIFYISNIIVNYIRSII